MQYGGLRRMAGITPEFIDLIDLLFALHVPDSLDKRRVLEYLHTFDPDPICSNCKRPLVCLSCSKIDDVSVDVSVRIGGRRITL